MIEVSDRGALRLGFLYVYVIGDIEKRPRPRAAGVSRTILIVITQ